MIDVADIASMLRAGRFDLSREALTQADIQAHLAARLPMGVLLEREKVMGPADRPDFLIDGRIVIEVKVKGAAPASLRLQLQRYAAYPQVEGIVLATGKSVALPAEIRGKPVHIVYLGAGWL